MLFPLAIWYLTCDVSLTFSGDGVVSHEELQQFVSSSGMTSLDDKEFDILFDSIDTDGNGELSYEEMMTYFDSLYVSIKEDFGTSIAKYLETGSKEEVDALWLKLDIDGDGTVSLEELELVSVCHASFYLSPCYSCLIHLTYVVYSLFHLKS